jgi:chemotaxis protein methyltransferase CheR
MARAGGAASWRIMNSPTDDLGWLEALLEGHYGFAPTGELRKRLASAWSNPTALEHETISRAGRLRQVVENLVVGETYFFRERFQIEYFVRQLWTNREQNPTSTRPCRILSAGCSSGEEAYTLAIALEALGPAIARNVSIHGVDVSAAAIRKAKKAVYTPWSLRATPDNVREACFRLQGQEYQLDERFRERVTFEERNLFDVDAEFWARGVFDAIFCRNVFIYFSERALRSLVARFAYVLPPGGYLFLGHSETLRGISDDFDLVHDADVFYYRRKGGPAAQVFPPPMPIDGPVITPPMVAPISVEVRSRPVVPSSEPSLARSVVSGEKQRADMLGQRIVGLIESERFDEAWGMLLQLPTDARTTLFTAVLSMAQGRFEDAERAAHALISSGQYEADAHCLLGTCREHQRAFDSAERHYRTATRFDRRFAIPHLRLGLLLDRSGDVAGGRIELEQALALIEYEDPERIALFGGGFSRKVLVELCKERLAVWSEARACRADSSAVKP